MSKAIFDTEISSRMPSQLVLCALHATNSHGKSFEIKWQMNDAFRIHDMRPSTHAHTLQTHKLEAFWIDTENCYAFALLLSTLFQRYAVDFCIHYCGECTGLCFDNIFLYCSFCLFFFCVNEEKKAWKDKDKSNLSSYTNITNTLS